MRYSLHSLAFVAIIVLSPDGRNTCVAQVLTLAEMSDALMATDEAKEAGEICVRALSRFDQKTLVGSANHTFAFSAMWRAHCRLVRPTEPRFGYIAQRYNERGVKRFVERVESRLDLRLPKWWISLLKDVTSEIEREDFNWTKVSKAEGDIPAERSALKYNKGVVEIPNTVLASVFRSDGNRSLGAEVGVREIGDCMLIISKPDFRGDFSISEFDRTSQSVKWRNESWGSGHEGFAYTGPALVLETVLSLSVEPETVTTFGAVICGLGQSTLEDIKPPDKIIPGKQIDAVFFIEQFSRKDGSAKFRFSSNLWHSYEDAWKKSRRSKRSPM